MKLFAPLILLVILLAVSVAVDQPRPRADLVTSYRNIETLDPQVTRASEDVRFAYALFEGLCSFDPHTMAVEPGVAWRSGGR